MGRRRACRIARRLRHAAWRRLHLRPRRVRHRAALAALDYRDARFYGGGDCSRRDQPARDRRLIMALVLASLVCGLVFGFGLLISGMVNPQKVLGFLDIFGAWDPSLAVVMGAA